MIRFSRIPILMGLAGALFGEPLRGRDQPAFNRDIRPILASKCFPCHGPDESHREADLRLDSREDAIDQGAIVPGEPDQSELLRRIFSEDAGERMPPSEVNEPLSGSEREMLRRWVAGGAEYEAHWAFVPPERPPVPEAANSGWPRNAIDHFVLARLEAEGLAPSVEADRYALVRRVHLDLIGLPPTPRRAKRFVHSRDPDAYEALVDELLASKHYGERWARGWLDLARYADTHGYEKDRERSIWPYRDWVIRALNRDMPFDEFTIEQIAGDMLPDATADQRVATGFHRNTMLNEEGGIDPLEYRFYSMVDRAATTGTVWLGLSTGCAQCHAHKYDPITHTDYFRWMALLNNADEPDLILETPAIAERRAEVGERIAALEEGLRARFAADPVRETAFGRWLDAQRASAAHWMTLLPGRLDSNLPKLKLIEDGSIFSSGDITKRDLFSIHCLVENERLPITSLRLEVLPDARLPGRGPGRAYYEGRKGDFFLSELEARHNGERLEFAAASHSYGKISVGSGTADATNVIDGKGSTGWSTSGREGEPHYLVLNLADPITVPGELRMSLLFERHFAASLGRFRVSTTSSPKRIKASETPLEIAAIVLRDEDSWTEADRARLERHFLRVAPELADARKPIEAARRRLPAFPTSMVMRERPRDNPRRTFRHHRGEFLNPREEVTPGIPAIFAGAAAAQPSNRLALARWLVSDRNPLTARVTVNRAWQSLIGAGLVRTSDDLGTRGDPPTHPDLLDWLACEFVEHGWSLKQLHRLIVTSATYRQTTAVSSELSRRDPRNRLLARASGHRMDAEIIRDSMLRSSGLLSDKMHGPSVFPPQPASVTALAYGGSKWVPSAGEDRYRRSLYTFSKRTAPFAAYTAFDAPSGESCIARRDRSNTPLQALTLLNDEMFLEMSRGLAKLSSQESSSAEIASLIFWRLLTRPPRPAELEAILGFQRAQRERFAKGELDASLIAREAAATPELASWVMTCRAVMNLDEAITRP